MKAKKEAVSKLVYRKKISDISFYDLAKHYKNSFSFIGLGR